MIPADRYDEVARALADERPLTIEQAAEAIVQAARIERADRAAEARDILAAVTLRDAVSAFNAMPISGSAVDALVDRVLHVADYLAPQRDRTLGDAMLGEVVGFSRRVAAPYDHRGEV